MAFARLLTQSGLWAERIVRHFWPVWTVLFFGLVPFLFGAHMLLPSIAAQIWVGICGILGIGFLAKGLWQFRRPTRPEVDARIDARLRGRPLQALGDTPADQAQMDLWRAHQERMRQRAIAAQPAAGDLRVSKYDPFGLRYVALLLVAFGGIWGTGQNYLSALGGVNAPLQANEATWEGWIAPPAYTGRPTLYLNDQAEGMIEAPLNSKVTIRLYGSQSAIDSISIAQTIAPQTNPEGDQSSTIDLMVSQSGILEISGKNGRIWQFTALADHAPAVTIDGPPRSNADGVSELPFSVVDDYGITAGKARITLDLGGVDRKYGLTVAPDPRDPIEVDLPHPIQGRKASYAETLREDFSKHAYANLPVTITLSVTDAAGQSGQSEPMQITLPGRRFFDPVAASLIEMRRDLLWSRENAANTAQILRALSYLPDGFLRSQTDYLRIRFIARQIEKAPLTAETQDEYAEALWTLALEIEQGDLEDARKRLKQAQDRLNQAMRNGANEQEIARLMQELRDATRDYMRQLAQENRKNQQMSQDSIEQDQEMMQMSQDDLQRMMDRIQELMNEGRMAEAQEALEEYQRMLENMQVAEGGQGQATPGQQQMDRLGETLRDQQDLSDDAFRDMQRQFNDQSGEGSSDPNADQQGTQSGEGSPEGDQGQQGGQQQGEGQNGVPDAKTLAERQQALRDQLQEQSRNLPAQGTTEGDAARQSLDRAGRSMDQAEEALREDDLGTALDRQSEAIDALRQGIRSLRDALTEERRNAGQQGQSGGGSQTAQKQDPLGREMGSNGQSGTPKDMMPTDDTQRRARELMDEIRRRSGNQDRPEIELDYLRRLLEQF